MTARTACAAKAKITADRSIDFQRRLALSTGDVAYCDAAFFIRYGTQKTTLNEALADVRIPPRHIEGMIRETAALIGDEHLDDRLRDEPGFHLKAIDMVQGLVIAMTLAQTLPPEEKFVAMIGPDSLLIATQAWQHLATPCLNK